MVVREVQWRAPDFRKAGRKATWQTLTLLCAFSLGIIAFMEHNVPFFIGIIVLEFIALIATRWGRSLIKTYTFNEAGLFIENELVYRRQEIARFALTDHYEEKIATWLELVLDLRRSGHRVRRVLVPHEQRDVLRAYLAQEWGLPEFEYQFGITEFFMRLIGL
jgi:hypothetical protein